MTTILDRPTADGRRKRIIGTRQQIGTTFSQAVGNAWFVFWFHAVRWVTLYPWRLIAHSPIGGPVALKALWDWVTDRAGRKRRDTIEAAVDKKKSGASSLTKASDQVRFTQYRNAFALVAVIVAAVAVLQPLWVDPPTARGWSMRWPIFVALGAAGLAGLGVPGRGYRGLPVQDDANANRKFPPLTVELFTEALKDLGHSELTRRITKDQEADRTTIRVRSSRTVDGDGTVAEIDLPVTAAEIIARYRRFCGNIRRPESMVWLEEIADDNPNTLRVIILDERPDPAKVEAVELPDKVDVFAGIKLGHKIGGAPFTLNLMWNAVLIAGAPRMGKSWLMRLLAAALLRDDDVDVMAFEFKGTGDLAPVRRQCIAYVQGDAPDDLAAAMAGLRWARDELRRRKRRLGQIFDQDERRCPENKITREIAADSRESMKVLVIMIDEFQALSTDPEYAAEFFEIVKELTKQGQTVGIIVVLGTQRPDADTLNTDIRAMATIRVCFRVNSGDDVKMVLGEGMLKRGFNPMVFSPLKDQGKAYVLNDGDPEPVRFDMLPPLDAIDAMVPVAERRAKAGRSPSRSAQVSGAPLDVDGRPFIIHVLTCFGEGEEWLPTSEIARRLPTVSDAYAGWTEAKAGEVTRRLKKSHSIRSENHRFEWLPNPVKSMSREVLQSAAEVDMVTA